MSKLNEIKLAVKKEVSAQRYEHIELVAKHAVELAKIHNVDPEKAEIAAYMHDFCREWSEEQREEYLNRTGAKHTNDILSHGPIAALIAHEKYGIEDTEILNAIKHHTLGAPVMSDLEKIIFISDVTSATDHLQLGKDIFELAKKSLESAVLQCFQESYNYLVSKKIIISETFMKNWEANKKTWKI